MVLVTGGSGSGKSEYAEKTAVQLNSEELYYIAAMYPEGEEAEKRIIRHKKMRAGKGFQTIECFTGIKKLQFRRGAVVLVECMSNLLANEMFFKEGAGPEAAAEEILDGILQIKEQAEHLIIVTNEVFSDIMNYDLLTKQYMTNLGMLNQRIARTADVVTEIVYSIPVCHKGVELIESI